MVARRFGLLVGVCMFCSYAQNFEDVILHRALREVRQGFYIDIGAQDPVLDSVSLGFYEMGWRGVHVECHSAYAQKLRIARPDEDVFEVFMSDQTTTLPFFEVSEPGLSTGNHDLARAWAQKGFTTRQQPVQAMRTSELLDLFTDRDIHWLKIDVEGAEKAVLDGWAPSRIRPWIVVVEAIDPITQAPSHASWEPILVGMGYTFVYFDGLNRFYLSREQQHLASAFGAGPNLFDRFRRLDAPTVCEIKALRAELDALRAAAATLQASQTAVSSSQGLGAMAKNLLLTKPATFLLFQPTGALRPLFRLVLFRKRGSVRRWARPLVCDQQGRLRPVFSLCSPPQRPDAPTTGWTYPDGAYVSEANKADAQGRLDAARQERSG